MKPNNKKKDIIVIGFALFSMFFGAGNVIFPPYLGMESGPQWMLGFVCYFLADIGLAVVAILAMLKINEDVVGMTKRAGRILSVVLSTAIVLCIGPLLATPRTGATTFEMSILPLFPKASSIIFSIVFFFIIWLLCIRESSVVDIIGKFLTPGLFIGLIILIIKGVVSPIGEIASSPKIASVTAAGIGSGYQTMDVLAALVFGTIILNAVTDKGYSKLKDRQYVIGGSAIVAAIGLLIVYGGLTYLGATVSQLYGTDIDRSVLIVTTVKHLLGQAGVIIFAIVVGLACVTTAVGLVSSCSKYFSNLSKQKISYKILVTVFCIFSAITSNIGLDMIISLAVPILNVVYPAALVIIILTIFGNHIKNDNMFKAGAIGALIVSFLVELANHKIGFGFMLKLPLTSLGLGWVIPVAVCILIGAFIPQRKKADRQLMNQE